MGIKNIGIIPDGTRRWAKRENLSLYEAYVHAFQNLGKQIDVLKARGVENVHIYLFSIYNLKRNIEEVTSCLDAECGFLKNLMYENYELIINGDLGALRQVHPEIVKVATDIPNFSNESVRYPVLHLYLGYSFKQYLDSLKKHVQDLDKFTETLLQNKIDLIIRTGGAITLSDFLPIESRYAQLYFLPMLFNDFSANALINLLDSFEDNENKFKYGE